MARKRFAFNRGVSGDLAFKFSRATATIDERAGRNHGTIGPNVPRWGGRSALCGAPVVTTVAGTTSESHDLMAVGVDADGVTPVYVVKKSTSGSISVYVGSLDSTPYSYALIPDALKDNNADLLSESVDNTATEAWNPKAVVVCHGLIVAVCNVHHNNGSTWGHRHLGVATCRISDLSGAKSGWWRRHARSDVLPGLTGISGTTNVGTTTSWAFQTYYVLDRDAAGTRPVKVWFAFVDYQTSSKLGGVFCVMPATRPTNSSGDWTVDSVYETFRFSRSTSLAHAHNLGLVREGTLGIVAYGSRGDASGNNCNYIVRLSSEGSATAANTSYRTGATLPTNGSVTAVNYYSGGSNWGSVEYTHGMIDTENGTWDDSAATPTLRRVSNQVVGFLPGPDPNTLIGSSDEVVFGPLGIVHVPPSGSAAKWRPLYLLSHNQMICAKATTDNAKLSRRNNCFNGRCPQPEKLAGPLVYQIAPSENDYTRDLQNKILFSPDSRLFSVAWQHRCPEQNAPYIDLPARKLWVGDVTTLGFGIRSIPLPDPLIAEPLLVAGGTKNYLKSHSGTVTTDYTNRTPTPTTITFNPALPAGASAPPTMSNFLYKLAYTGASGNGDMAVFWLTQAYNHADAIPTSAKKVTVKLWVLCEPTETFPGSVPTYGSNSAGAQFKFRFRANDGGGNYLAGYTAPIAAFNNAADGWMPVTVEFDPTFGKATAMTTGISIEMFVEAAGGAGASPSNIPCNMYLACESVTITDSPPYPLPVVTTGVNEIATLSGFSAAGSFSAAAIGATPLNASWDMAAPPAFYLTNADPTASDTTTTLTGGIASDNFYNGCRLNSHDQTKIASGAYGLLISAYNGTTKVATHEAHTGTRSGTCTVDIMRTPAGYSAANPGLRPLWSMCDASATTGFTVFAHTGTGALCIAYWNGSAYGSLASIPGVWWLGGSPVLSSVVYDATAQTLTLVGSVGGIEIGTAALSSITFSAPLTEMRFASLDASPTVTAMSWFGGFVDDAAAYATSTLSSILAEPAKYVAPSPVAVATARAPRIGV